ncbi:hypothetical protein BG006_006522 [Podila minutissima]|uniref:Uncharacterized protein n=1 Tax=Podila minutissima TaxID=64525 RepID=A0A9P5SL35_9FUNG|nr:hypothetical protein BG006_006522 [Podila minutissima]
MKIAFVSLAALVSVVMATPGAPEVSEAARSKFDGNSKCSVSGFRPSFSKIDECCLKNTGGSDVDKKSTLKCRLPVSHEGPMRKCAKDLGFATVFNCDY